MVALLQPPPSKRPRPNLILHCGARAVSRHQVTEVFTPRNTPSWQPIPHIDLVTEVERTLKTNRLIVGTQAHSLTHDGARYFGLMEVQRDQSDDDYTWVLGLRNSHDKTFPAGIAAGMTVFVCDNLSFSGEVKLARKHTRFIIRDLPQLVQSAVGKLMDRWHHQDTRLRAYKLTELFDRGAHDLVIRACDVGVCPNKLIPKVLREWREPRHEAFEARNVWSLFNSFTEALKGNLIELPRRTEALHGLFDTHVGLHSLS
ncbi:MAG: hypothetical protein QOD99_2554 [Chthoniobacter sp.]|jgi:hypothetical protein|nr:hypothetical protein [Chthoniobacter sp.]